MSSDPSGILAYGISLGVEEEIDTEKLAWYQQGEGLYGSVQLALLASVGFTETWATSPDQRTFHARERAAWAELGVEVVLTGTYEYSGLVLSVKKQDVEWSEVAVADLMIPDGAAERLARAVAALPGLKPVNTDPAWLLAAFYG